MKTQQLHDNINRNVLPEGSDGTINIMTEQPQPTHSPLRQVTVAEYGTFFALKNGSDTLATSPIREPLDELARRYNSESVNLDVCVKLTEANSKLKANAERLAEALKTALPFVQDAKDNHYRGSHAALDQVKAALAQWNEVQP